jgi:Flp pilus assembly protein TadG
MSDLRPDRRRRSRAQSRRSLGQSLAEFALIVPVLAATTMGTVDLARGFTSYMALVSGVREGALYAATSMATTFNDATYRSRMSTEVINAGGKVSSLSISSAQCSPAGSITAAAWTSCVAGGNAKFVRVHVTYAFTPVTPFISTIAISVTEYSAVVAQ